ncbi:MAG: efflux RND transporter periplasmic adaptor subunit [Victivallaceae bacterium]|nr:efflux RND transporter periplasmic adaptor subunit [Victivallaceae bacterium]
MKKRKLIILSASGLALAAAAAAAAVLMADSRRELDGERTEPAERVVKLFKINAAEKPVGITYPGRIRPVRHAELFFRVSGPVIERNLVYGQTVEEGDVLMRIDPRDYQRDVDRLTQELEMQKVENSLASIEYDRNQKLLESKAVSQSTFDAASTRKRASDTQVRILEVSLNIAKDRLHDTVLTAPFHGTISDLAIEQYEIAKANVPVVTLEDLREVEIHINIPSGNLPDTSLYDGKRFIGMKFDVTIPGRGDRVFQAAIHEFKPAASETSESYEVALRMKVPDDFLILPGMSVEVHGLPRFRQKEDDGLRLPFAAVMYRDGGAAVWVWHRDTGKLELRKVTVDRVSGGDSVTVVSGLVPGEYVVAAGGDWLNADTAVRILNPEVLNENH